MLKKRSFIVFASAVSLCAPLWAADTYLSYENKEAGVKLKYPADWIVSESVPGAVVAFGVPKDKANLKMVENVMLVLHDVTPDATLEKFTQAYDEKRKNMENPPLVVESKKTKLGGSAAQRILCVGVQNGMQIEFLQIWTLKGRKAYLLTYGAEKNSFAKFQKEAEKIISSFEFIKK